MSKPKIAIVHDYLNQYGGAEKVLEAISEVFPQAPIYTSIYDKGKLRNLGFEGDSKKIITGFTQKLPFRNILPRYYLTPFYPFVFLSFDFSNYDIIISSSSFAAKYLRKKKAVHICYCHTPPRFLWGFDTDINIDSMRFFERPIARACQRFLRKLDFYMAQKVDLFLTNSENVKKRIEKVYSRDSKVVYPPIDTDRFDLKKAKIGDYFLIVSRLGEYKKIDIVINVFNKLKLPLKIIGEGSQFEKLKKNANKNIEFLGSIPSKEIDKYYLECKAFIMAADEDFGIAPVEALAAGKSVLAYRGGGVLESVVSGETGEFFNQQTESSLIASLKKFDPLKYNPEKCKERAQKFSKRNFKEKLEKIVNDLWEKQAKTFL